MNFKLTHLLGVLFMIFIVAFIIVVNAKDNNKEGFDTVPIKFANAEKNLVVYGYYQVDASNMAVIPYGYKVDPDNPKKIIAQTITAKYATKMPKNAPAVPAAGQKMPDSFYLMTDSSLGVLPPNMMPDVSGLDFVSNASRAPIVWTYRTGYVSETEYYAKKFTHIKTPLELPDEVYYVDEAKQYIGILPFGMIADASNGYGYIQNPDYANNKPQYDYAKLAKDVSGNYDLKFHDTIDDIKSQNKESDLSFGEVRVRNQNGDIVILPKLLTQDLTTFYQPGEFKYGAATYVPNYEDSVYLSALSKNAPFVNELPYNYNSCANKACAVYQYVKNTLSPYCANANSQQ
jgi:hypothetical protein